MLKATFGAGLVRFQPTSQRPVIPSAVRRPALRGLSIALRIQAKERWNMRTNPRAASAARCLRVGGSCGVQGSSVRTISSLGSTSKSSIPTSVAEIPSAIEWWVL